MACAFRAKSSLSLTGDTVPYVGDEVFLLLPLHESTLGASATEEAGVWAEVVDGKGAAGAGAAAEVGAEGVGCGADAI